jgi:type I restriction enzyme S subunit
MKQWPTLPLGEVAPIVRRPVKLDQGTKYREIGARSYGRGLFEKPEFDSAEATWEKPVRIAKGDLVFSNIKAWEGAISWATDAHDGCIASHRYITCVPRADLALPEFLARYLLSHDGLAAVGQASRGSADRNRTLSLAGLAAIPVPVPPLEYQQRLVRHLERLTEKTRQVEAHLDAAERDAERLIRSYLFGTEHDSVGKRRLSDLVSQRPPDVAVDGTSEYRFAGVYSFGRGVFASAVKMGSEFAYERLSTVHAGDFIYPKLMAWEGALGVVPPVCDGMVVSPEFPVFTVNIEAVLPEVLDIYFRTPDVWPALAEISGGTNARRRRLQPSAFLSYEMPVPSMAKQLELRAIYQHTQALKAKHAAIREANAALIPATLERVFSSQTREKENQTCC